MLHRGACFAREDLVARARTEGVTFETTFDVKGEPRYLKAVVYDYAADKLGSAVAQIT